MSEEVVTAQQERAKIVAWLRAEAERYWDMRHPNDYGADDHAGNTLDFAADAIERGEHAQEQEGN